MFNFENKLNIISSNLMFGNLIKYYVIIKYNIEIYILLFN